MWRWENISENHKEIKFFKVPASIISSCIQFKSGYKNCNSGTSIVSSDKLLLTFKQRNNVFRNDVKYIGNDSYFLTAVTDESEEWSSQLISNLSNWKAEAWKNQGFNGIRTRDLRDTGAMLYQATHWERGEFIEFISPVRRLKKN